MNPPSVDIKDMLLSESGIDLTYATNLFIGKEPASPDNVVTIFDAYASTPQLTMEGNLLLPYERHSLQIRVRNRDYQLGYNLINEIFLLLHGRAHETWNGAIYEVITSSAPMHFDWDDNKRARFIINLNLQRKDSGGS
jgi:hypothetical protein